MDTNTYCKNCKNMIGTWNDAFQDYDDYEFYYLTESTKNEFIKFLDCMNCTGYVGILYYYVCINCFGKNKIIDNDKKLFNWFLKHKKINSNFICNICNKDEFRYQYWFF